MDEIKNVEEELQKVAVDEHKATPEERMAWLRARGVEIVDPEEKTSSAPAVDPNAEMETVTYVHVPQDTSKKLQELSFSQPKGAPSNGDALSQHLAPVFGSTAASLDLSLFQNKSTSHVGSAGAPTEVSDATLRKVAAKGSVETFALVRPCPSNKFTGINIYLDEVGMMKRLPVNTRAADFAARAGFNPPPTFYGDVFIGRVSAVPQVKNESFKVGIDTNPDAAWLEKAAVHNLEYQADHNRMTGNTATQASNAGEDGKEKVENGYSWTQTDDEVEVVVPLPQNCTTKAVKVKFLPKSIQVNVNKVVVLTLDFFAKIDPDGCTWTLDKDVAEKKNLVITCEKADPVSWPRIQH
jgi:hypothetical protein